MERDRSDLLLFIDLGFILLVGFLMLTDTTPQENVPLPPKVDENESKNPSEQLRVDEVFFDADLDFMVVALREQVEVCRVDGLTAVVGCLSALVNQTGDAVFVLIPRGRSTVQQLVSMLDLCRQNGWRCTVDT